MCLYTELTTYYDVTVYAVMQNKREDVYGSLDPYQLPSEEEAGIYSQLRTYGIHMIPRQAIK